MGCFGGGAVAHSKPYSCHGPERTVHRRTQGWGELWLAKDLCLLSPPSACLELQQGVLPGLCLGCPWLLCRDLICVRQRGSHFVSDGYYIYLQGSNALPGFVAQLLSPVCSSEGPHCFRFWYHMYGAAETMALRVYVAKDKEIELVWSSTGNQGDRWNVGEITVHSTGNVQVRAQALSAT